MCVCVCVCVCVCMCVCLCVCVCVCLCVCDCVYACRPMLLKLELYSDGNLSILHIVLILGLWRLRYNYM